MGASLSGTARGRLRPWVRRVPLPFASARAFAASRSCSRPRVRPRCRRLGGDSPSCGYLWGYLVDKPYSWGIKIKCPVDEKRILKRLTKPLAPALPEAVENHHHLNGGPLRRRLQRGFGGDSEGSREMNLRQCGHRATGDRAGSPTSGSLRRRLQRHLGRRLQRGFGGALGQYEDWATGRRAGSLSGGGQASYVAVEQSAGR